MSEVIEITRSANEIVNEAYVELAKYTARTRNYPGLIDGMKMVYRRLIYSSKDTTKMTKAAKIVGQAIGIHPHGDSSIYDVLVECTCKYNSFPLFDGKGNYGGLGSMPSSMRYPEAKIKDITKLMYLELIDYADYIEGEVNEEEPAYLPALIPYCFLEGCSGFSVGMPAPDIFPMNALDLVNYYINLLEGKEVSYPTPDYGSVILNCEKAEHSDPVIRDGDGQLWFEPFIIQEDYNKVVINQVPPYSRIDKANKKLSWYIDQEYIDFNDETNEDGHRYVYTINNFNKISIDQLKDILNKSLKCSHSYRFMFEYNSNVYKCGFDFVVKHQMNYLRKCTKRKYDDYLQKSKSKSEVLLAISKLREDKKTMSKLHQMSTSELKSIIVEWGYSESIASSVVSKPISYLTRSHDDELINEYNNQELYQSYINDPDKYLLTLYYQLKDMIIPFYKSRVHSVFKNDLSVSEKNRCRLSDDHSHIEFSNDYSTNWTSMLYATSKYGKIQGLAVPKFTITPIELMNLENDEFINIVGDESKYIIFIYCDSYISVISRDKIKSGLSTYLKLWDGDYPANYVFGYDEDWITFIDSHNNPINIKLDDYVKSRISLPQKITKYSYTLKAYQNKDGDRFEINTGI